MSATSARPTGGGTARTFKKYKIQKSPEYVILNILKKEVPMLRLVPTWSITLKDDYFTENEPSIFI